MGIFAVRLVKTLKMVWNALHFKWLSIHAKMAMPDLQRYPWNCCFSAGLNKCFCEFLLYFFILFRNYNGICLYCLETEICLYTVQKLKRNLLILFRNWNGICLYCLETETKSAYILFRNWNEICFYNCLEIETESAHECGCNCVSTRGCKVFEWSPSVKNCYMKTRRFLISYYHCSYPNYMITGFSNCS